MSISDKLAGLNAARFSEWQPKFTPDNARQALLAFKGDVYTGLQAQDFNEADFDFAQQHLRMLSGLYGVLRPLDLMMPYRLEMGIKLENPKGKICTASGAIRSPRNSTKRWSSRATTWWSTWRPTSISRR